MTPITKYYTISLLPSSLIAIAIHIVWAIFEYDPNYKSEWMAPGDAEIWSIAIVVINALIISTLSLTIFYNNILYIKNHLFPSLITWFAAPMFWIGFLLNKTFQLILSGKLIDGDGLFLLINTIPYLIGLIWGFTKFRREVTNSNNSL